MNDLEVWEPPDETVRVAVYAYRYYDPVTGRWPSRDPLASSGSTASFSNGVGGFLNVENLSSDFLIDLEKALYGFVSNNPVSAVDILGLWNFYKWAYCGDGNASGEEYDEALDRAAEYADCYLKCLADVNKQAAAALAAAAGASPVPKVGVPRLPGSIGLTSKTRVLSVCSRSLTGSSALTNALNKAARGVKAAPGAAAARGGVAGLSFAELAAVACCVKKCVDETL